MYGNGGNKTWIMISIAVAIIIMFVVGLTVLRQTKAIWHMNSSNAVTMNTTMNTFTSVEPILIIIAIAGIILLVMSVNRGFGD